MADDRRIYYDHEPAYRRIKEQGGEGWDDLHPEYSHDSYGALTGLLDQDARCPAPGARALDLGCGGGQVTMMLAERGYDVWGIDYSETAVELALQNLQAAGHEAKVTVGDCIHLDGVPHAHFDLVVDNHVLHCILGETDRRAFLSSATRVLRPGGIFFSETMSAEGEVDYEAWRIDRETRITEHRTRFFVTEAELRGELASAGLEVLSIERRAQPDEPPAGDTLVTVARKPH